MKAWKLLLVGILVLVLAPSFAAAKTLKIGSMSPLTGQYAADGTDIKQGVETAIAVWKAKGGVKGFDKIEYFPQDSGCDGKQAVSAANKLVNLGVVGVVGAYCSSATIPASVVLNDAKVVMITPASTNEKITSRGFKYMFRACGRDDDQAKLIVDYLVKGLKAKKVALIDDKTAYTAGLTENIKKFGKGKLDIVAHEHINQGDKDFSGVLTKIRAKKPDVVYVSTYNPEGNLIAIQGKRLGLNATYMSNDAVFHPNFLKIAKDSGEGWLFTFGLAPKADVPMVAKFNELYNKKYGKPGSYSSYAFDAANILLSAINKAGTDPDKLAAAIRAYQGQGASKAYKFDAKGDSGSNYVVYIVKGGKFVPYWNPETGKKF